jgi:hypothetical protein
MTRTPFEQWMNSVNEHVLRLSGLDVADLPDVCYADFWSHGDSPLQAARRALANARDEDPDDIDDDDLSLPGGYATGG